MRHAAVTADARTKIPDARGSKVSYVSSIITVITVALSPSACGPRIIDAILINRD